MIKSLAALFAFLLSAVTASAEAWVLSAPDAQAALRAGEMIVLDIRSPEEWAETGVAEGAWPVSMHQRDFGANLQAILSAYDPSQIALICATGGRSDFIRQALEKNGVTGVADISEGMMGNGRAPGWLARGLPVVTAPEAAAAYERFKAELPQ